MNPNPPDLPIVSVIIRTYQGRQHFLKEALDSVVNQTYRFIELIVIEDGSNEAKDIVTSLTRHKRFSQVIYQAIPKLGRSRAGNTGLAQATGSFIVFLDDDDLFLPEHVEYLVTALLSAPECAAAYSLALQVAMAEGKEIRRELVYQQPFSRKLLWCRNYLPIQSVLFRKALYEKHGGFSEKLDQLEDWELWIRYSLEHEFRLVKQVTSLYRVPHDANDAWERQKKLDASYLSVVESIKKINVTLPAYWYFYVLSRHYVKRMFFQFSFLHYCYRLLSMKLKKQSFFKTVEKGRSQ